MLRGASGVVFPVSSRLSPSSWDTAQRAFVCPSLLVPPTAFVNRRSLLGNSQRSGPRQLEDEIRQFAAQRKQKSKLGPGTP